MAIRALTAVLVLITAAIGALPDQVPQKPYTRDKVQAVVRDGLGDETGAKALAQRGIDFTPTDESIQTLKTTGAGEAFLAALRAATRPSQDGLTLQKPLSEAEIFALLAWPVPSRRIALLVKNRGIDFEPDNECLQHIDVAGISAESFTPVTTTNSSPP